MAEEKKPSTRKRAFDETGKVENAPTRHPNKLVSRAAKQAVVEEIDRRKKRVTTPFLNLEEMDEGDFDFPEYRAEWDKSDESRRKKIVRFVVSQMFGSITPPRFIKLFDLSEEEFEPYLKVFEQAEVSVQGNITQNNLSLMFTSESPTTMGLRMKFLEMALPKEEVQQVVTDSAPIVNVQVLGQNTDPEMQELRRHLDQLVFEAEAKDAAKKGVNSSGKPATTFTVG